MAHDTEILYEIDEHTRELLEAALNMVSQTAHLQINEEAALGLIELCDEIAARFGIESDEISVIDEHDTPNRDDGPPTITVYRTHKQDPKRPVLTVIDGDKMDDTPPDDDDQLH